MWSPKPWLLLCLIKAGLLRGFQRPLFVLVCFLKHPENFVGYPKLFFELEKRPFLPLPTETPSVPSTERLAQPLCLLYGVHNSLLAISEISPVFLGPSFSENVGQWTGALGQGLPAAWQSRAWSPRELWLVTGSGSWLGHGDTVGLRVSQRLPYSYSGIRVFPVHHSRENQRHRCTQGGSAPYSCLIN